MVKLSSLMTGGAVARRRRIPSLSPDQRVELRRRMMEIRDAILRLFLPINNSFPNIYASDPGIFNQWNLYRRQLNWLHSHLGQEDRIIWYQPGNTIDRRNQVNFEAPQSAIDLLNEFGNPLHV